ncbi:MAG: hypothetical protein HYX63_13560 [Gammaproteobacteria bacterium]|nr:hypothetical protein [Gammaproteobacteria bacterium]
MGRQSLVNRLPAAVRMELDRLTEEDFATAEECQAVLLKLGHWLSMSCITRYRRNLKHGAPLKRVVGLPLDRAVVEVLQGDPEVLKLVGEILRLHTRQSALIDQLYQTVRAPLRKSLNKKFAEAEIARQQ